MTISTVGTAPRQVAGLVALVVSIASVGCNGSHDGPTAQASGTATLDGRPLEGAEVQLIPRITNLGTHGTTTDSNGAFAIRPNPGSNTPLRPGIYTPLIRKISSRGNDPSQRGGGMASVANEIPMVYQDRNRTPLGTVEIKEGENSLPPFQLKSTPQKR